MLALAIVALLAALALPSARFGTGPGLQRYEAQRIVALLRADRNAALRTGRSVTTLVDLPGRRLVSGDTGGEISLSPALALAVQPGDLRAFAFTAAGRSSGGRLLLGTRERGVGIRVDPQTAAVRIEAF